MIITKAKLEDLENIIAIEQHVFNTDSYPAFVVRQLFDISGHYFLVAKEENEVLGYALGGFNTKENRGWVLSLGVQEKGRGKGLGKQLTEQLIKVLKTQNPKDIFLTVYPNNVSAIKIYKDLGFEGEKVLDNYFLDNQKRIVMIKKLY